MTIELLAFTAVFHQQFNTLGATLGGNYTSSTDHRGFGYAILVRCE